MLRGFQDYAMFMKSDKKPATLVAPPSPRSKKLRWLVAVSTLPFLGTLGAFALAPDTSAFAVDRHAVVEALALPADALAVEDTSVYHREDIVRPGDTLGAILTRMGAGGGDIQALLASAGAHDAVGRLRTGQRLRAATTANGELLELSYATPSREVVMKKGEDGYTVQASEPVLETRSALRTGIIASSLFAAMDAAGVPDAVADRLTEVLSTRIDFREDVRKGDTFSVVFEEMYRDGERVATGKLLAAEFVNEGKAHRVALYRDASGREDYYTPEGESLKKGFLRSPLEFSRVTSNFSNSRKHPVYGFHRAHPGVDFGAPTGTRVRATGDATVVFAGRKGGYGNLLVLRHPNGFETYYAHLSGFAKGIRKGSAVSQGSTVAYVGSTGASTGPHLHYEIRVAGKPHNPMSLKLPGSPPLSVAQRRAFEQQTQTALLRLNMVRGINLAALD